MDVDDLPSYFDFDLQAEGDLLKCRTLNELVMWTDPKDWAFVMRRLLQIPATETPKRISNFLPVICRRSQGQNVAFLSLSCRMIRSASRRASIWRNFPFAYHPGTIRSHQAHCTPGRDRC